MDMEGYFTIYLDLFGGYHGISPFSDGRCSWNNQKCAFSWEAPIVCGVWRFSWGYHGVPVNHPVEIGIFHYKLSSYWGTKFWEISIRTARLSGFPWQETAQHVKQSNELSKDKTRLQCGSGSKIGYPYEVAISW